MQRRGFLKGLAAIIGGVALEQAVPFGRVWSFPKEIKCVNSASVISATIEQYADFVLSSELLLPSAATIYYDRMALDRLKKNFTFLSENPSVYSPYRATIA